MKKIVYFVIIALVLGSSVIGYGQNLEKSLKKKKDFIRDQMLFNSAQGREFWLAMPMNDPNNTEYHALEIYVTASKNTAVTMESPAMGVYLTKPVTAMKITTFSSVTGECSFQWECRASEEADNKGIRIFAGQPISVYVLNAKLTTSDGYLGLPLTALGTEYIHCSYYDHNEVYPWASGFICIATENQTKIRIELRGKGYARTKGGRKIGDVINTMIDAGQVYMVKGDATTRMEFDMTGSKIVGNKPIGLISFHERTHIPSYDIWNGRDHLCEMITPTHSWGKKYTTIELFREQNKGDFFRVVASQPNTNVKCVWYDKNNDKVLGHWDFPLNKAGDYNEFLQAYITQSGSMESIRGVSVFTADKPVLVVQYAYSMDWDGAPLYDPFEVLVVPQEQYIPGTVFQTPSNQAFVNNFFNIIAIHDPADTMKNDLRSITLDGKPIYVWDNRFLNNKIPNENLYWAMIKVSPGAHVLKGDTKFGGYIYGMSYADSYGWPAAMAINKVDETDTLPPQLYPTYLCGNYKIITTEVRNGGVNDNPRQIDQGVADVQLLDGSFNYELVFKDTLKPFPPLYNYTFYLNIINPLEPAFAIYSVIDRYGNVAIDSVRFYPDSLTMTPDKLDFGNVRVRTTSRPLTADITNISDSTIKIKEIKLKAGSVFKIVTGAVPPEIDLLPGQIHQIIVEYTPIKEGLTPLELDIDSIFVTTGCLVWKWPVQGRGVLPKINVGDWNAGAVPVGNKVSKTATSGSGLIIDNIGTDTLIIYGLENVLPPFSVSSPMNPDFPFKIAPGASANLTEEYFQPPDTLDYTLDVTVKSNAEGVDSISRWMGRGITPGPVITSDVWLPRRVLTINDSTIRMYNLGNVKVLVTDVNFAQPTTEFTLDKQNVQPKLPIELWPQGTTGATTEIIIPVSYIPQEEGTHHAEVIPTFDDPNVPTGSIPNGMLDGTAYLPKITLEGYEFLPEILVNIQHPDIGTVKINSVSETADLYIQSIAWKDPNQTEFKWNGWVPQDTIIKKGTSIILPVTFKPNSVNPQRREAFVTVISDAAPGPDVNPRITTETSVIGHTFDTGIKVDPLDFPIHMICDKPDSTFGIYNQSTTNPITVESITLASATPQVFTLLTTTPFDIPPLGKQMVQVNFSPDQIGAFSAVATIKYHFKDMPQDEIQTTITGKGKLVNINLSLATLPIDNSVQNQIAPGMRTSPSAPNLLFPVKVNCTDQNGWLDATIKSFTIQIIYETGKLQWTGKAGDAIAKNNQLLDGSWTVTGVEVDDITLGKTTLTITGSGQSIIPADGNLVYPEFLILLSDSASFPVKYGNVSFGGKDYCVRNNTSPGSITVNTCVQKIRSVIFSNTNYALNEILPNPVGNDGFTLNYAVGLKDRTTIELYNSALEQVAVLVDEEMDSGKYEKFIPTTKLSSGVYYIRMNSGPFSDMKRVVIAK